MNPEQVSQIAQAKQPQPLECSQEMEDWEKFAEELSDIESATVVGGMTGIMSAPASGSTGCGGGRMSPPPPGGGT